MRNENDTCRELVEPKLRAAGWETSPHSITEQYRITKGRIVVAGQQARRATALRVDYLLQYAPDFNIAVVEAKAEGQSAQTAIQQAKDYAQIARVALRLRHERPRHHRSRSSGGSGGDPRPVPGASRALVPPPGSQPAQ